MRTSRLQASGQSSGQAVVARVDCGAGVAADSTKSTILMDGEAARRPRGAALFLTGHCEGRTDARAQRFLVDESRRSDVLQRGPGAVENRDLGRRLAARPGSGREVGKLRMHALGLQQAEIESMVKLPDLGALFPD